MTVLLLEGMIGRLTDGARPRDKLSEKARAEIIEAFHAQLVNARTSDEARARIRAELEREVPKDISLLGLSLLGIRRAVEETERALEPLSKAVLAAAMVCGEEGFIYRLGEVNAQLIAMLNLAEVTKKDLGDLMECIAGTCGEPHPEKMPLQKGGDA